MSKIAAIVLSAGSGSRMKTEIPKQYLPLLGYPVIYYSLKAFEESCVDEIVLVTGEKDISYCQNEIVNKYNFKKVHAIVAGGKERYDSVYEGLKKVKACDYVLIHDGARPILSQDVINRSIETVKKTGACVVGMPVKDTIKMIDDACYAKETPDRSHLWLVQTPQSFSVETILNAYSIMKRKQEEGSKLPTITDDAMLVETMLDKKVKLIEGSYRNIKITTPEDLEVAEIFLKKKLS